MGTRLRSHALTRNAGELFVVELKRNKQLDLNNYSGEYSYEKYTCMLIEK